MTVAALADIVTLVRADLKDVDPAAYRWTDAELEAHIHKAVQEYSHVCPNQHTEDVATAPGSRDIDISGITGIENLEKIFAVEFPIGNTPRTFLRFENFASVLSLVDEILGDGNDARIYWGGLHVLDDSSTPTTTIPAPDQRFIVTGAAAFAMIAEGSYATNRVNLGGPWTPKDYLAWGNARLAEFQKSLARAKSQLRTSVMYPPAETHGHSQTTDWGP